MKDLYKILEINTNSSSNEIKSSYKKLALKYHPDRNTDGIENNDNKFKKITEAYETLSDPQKKHNYDNPVPTFNMVNLNNNIPHNLHHLFKQMNNLNLNNQNVGNSQFQSFSFQQFTQNRNCNQCAGSGFIIKIIKTNNLFHKIQYTCTLCMGRGSI